ncbi:hypothetical protein [Parasphingorhabdus sp.]|uniref:hypothetical protein n=1 Tax=Parasphingorhabdus sp. TaxID=2709688 RepID=UPI00309870EA|nr:hypothetical protein [Sphingomonadales bacterium]
MEDESKTAVIPAALGFVVAAVLAGAAKFGELAQGECEVGDGFDAAGFGDGPVFSGGA